MDSKHFDALTRSVASEGETRRAVLRLLAAGALGALAAHLGLTEVAEAKRKHKKPKKRPSQAERKSRGQLQAEGKGKKKGKGKKPKSDPPPLPPGCQQCNDCQMCQDGVCVPDVELEGVRCQGSGASCGYCQIGQCAPSVLRPCEDGVCPQQGQCCPEEKRCPDPESPTGFACLDKNACCPDEKRCASGCRPRIACCPEERPQCGQCGEICVNGTWQCSAQKPCAGGVCVAADECCPNANPTCGGCEEAVCEAGELVCRSTCLSEDAVCCAGTCFSPCDNGCDINETCDACNQVPAGKVYCPGLNKCVSTACPPGQEFDEVRCRCVNVFCSNNSDSCPGDWSKNTCGGPRSTCHCLRSVSGDVHCVDRYSRVYASCGQDADCDHWYGEPGKGMCEECARWCYAKGCPE